MHVITITSVAEYVQLIPHEKLRPGPWQARRIFDQEALEELALSIKTNGVLTPLRVVPIAKEAEFDYLIVAGERRWRAALIVGITELPCLVMEEDIGDGSLRELAVLDNLHRANLRPGEEARAIANLARGGLNQSEIARRLGKSVTWISQRCAISKLPGSALEQLDGGTITREEALALSKLLDYPELVEACLEPNGMRLRMRLKGHLPEGICQRVQAVLRVLEMERQREAWAAKMRSDGHEVLEESPRDGDRRYVRLLSGSLMARTHQQARLSCEAWAWEYGYANRYCIDPEALKKALTNSQDPFEQARLEENQRILERQAARDSAVSAWLATSRSVETWELAMLARERIQTLVCSDDGLLSSLGKWLGVIGDRQTCVSVAEKELACASERRLFQLWFLIELANTTSYSVIPTWSKPWLERLGFFDPAHLEPQEPCGLDSGMER